MRPARLVVLSLLVLAACSKDARVESIDNRSAAPGDTRHVFGPVNQETLGACEVASVGVVTTKDDVVVTTQPCQVCCGYERQADQAAVEVVRLNGTEQQAIAGDATRENFRVVDAGPNDELYAVAGSDILRYNGDSWNVEWSTKDLPPTSGDQPLYFSTAEFGPDGALYAAVTSGVVRFDERGAEWLREPLPMMSVPTPVEDGAVVPPSPSAEIRDLEIARDNEVIAMTDQQVLVVELGKETRVLLDAANGATTPGARILPQTTTLRGGVSSCCDGSRFGAIELAPNGDLYVLETSLGRLIRFDALANAALVGGRSPNESKCDCYPPSKSFGPEGDDASTVDDVSLVPALVGPAGNLMALSDDGALYVALGAGGVVRIADVDQIQGR